MIPPLLSQSSRQLLQRFFVRESQRSAILASSTSSSSSSEPSSSASTSSNTTPQHLFKGEVTRNINGHVRYKKPRYNPRQQKKLFRAMEIVKMQNELFGSVVQSDTQSSSGLSSSSADGEDVPVTANAVVKDTFGTPLPEDWKLPTSSKIKSTLSFFDDGASAAAATSPAGRSNREIDALSKRSSSAPFTSSSLSSSTSTRQYTFKDATSRGPYKGRSANNNSSNAKNAEEGPFKLHKWERTKEATRFEREEKLKTMPARMEEYTKVSLACLFPRLIVRKS